MAYAYEHTPGRIYEESFRIIRAEADLTGLPAECHDVAIRIVHACGMVDVASGLIFSQGVVAAAERALNAGAPIFCDAEMVARGVIRRALPPGTEVLTTLNDPGVPDLAAQLGTTRSAAAVDLWRDRIGGALVVIGNAPTALFHLLERIEAGWPEPAAILGFPVGFVGAAESKAALAGTGLNHITLPGRRGGSAMAAAAVNALTLGLAGDGT